jgi:glycosyltransferase involved in cell wall biosynthesis
MVVHARYPIGEPRVQREAAAAVAAGYEVDVICLRHPGEPQRELVEGVRVHRLPVRHERRRGPVRMALEYLAFLLLATAKVAQLDAARRYPLVHVSNPPDLLVLAGLVAKLRGARVILDVHDLTPDLFEWRFGTSGGGRLARRLLLAQERLALRLADRVMTVHGSCADVLADRGSHSRQAIVIVMNTADEQLLGGVERPPSSRWHDPVRVVYHGSLTELYGVHVLIGAFARGDLARRATLTIVGDGDQRDALVRQADRLGIRSSVRFSDGYLPISEALAAVAACDIGVVPLLGLPINRFSLPSKLFEYVALGLPVVAARTETIERHFSVDELTFFRPGDPVDLAHRLVELINDEEGPRARAERAAARAYSWRADRARFLELLATT